MLVGYPAPLRRLAKEPTVNLSMAMDPSGKRGAPVELPADSSALGML